MKYFKLSLCVLFITILLFYSTIPSIATSEFVWSNQSASINETQETSADIENNSLNLESGSAILIEQSTGQILYSHNIHEQLRPASVTKVMTILLIMEAIDSGKISLDDMIPCSEKAASMGGSQIWLNTTETLSVNDMLKAICVVSANDCCVAMAEYLEGSTESFVQKMNEKAKQLGMNDTVFKNCHGIDEDGHVSSAYDIALMSKELLTNHPSIVNYTTIWMDSLRDGKSELVNTNKLIRNYKGATGLKTGSTSLALYNLSASATRDGLSLIAVIMKAPSTKVRFSEAQKLLDYGFSNYSFTSLATKDEVLTQVPISKGLSSSVNAVFESDFGYLCKKGNSSEISNNINIPEGISAPVSKGEIIGNVTFYENETLIGSVNLIADSDIEKLSFITMSQSILQKWFNLMR